MSDPNFDDTLNQALADPKGKVAQTLVKKVLPLLNFAGRKSAYGAVERSVAITKISEMSRRFFAASVFLTIALDDINNPAAFVLTFCSVNQAALINDGFRDVNALIDQATVTIGSGTVRCDRTARAKAAMDNPVAYVTEYKKCLIDILSILLGRPASSFVSKDDGDTVCRTQYFEDCCKGILGHMIAWYLVNKDHSKGTLHSHLIGGGGLPPRVLQMAGGIQNLCDAVSKTLDSQYVARLEPQRLVTEIFHRRFQKYSFRISSGPSKPPVLLSSLQRHENFLRNTRHDATAQQSAMPVHFAEFSGDMNTIM